MKREEVIKILDETKALLKGHFILSSGLHSKNYVQCARLFKYPWKAQKIAEYMARRMRESFSHQPDILLSPAFGGLFFAYELSRQLECPNIFAERNPEGNGFILRRGFHIKKDAKVVIIEDVITTGKSTRECIDLIHSYEGELIGITSVIDRTNKNVDFGVPYLSAIELDFPVFQPDQLPEDLANIPAIKPGSRQLKESA